MLPEGMLQYVCDLVRFSDFEELLNWWEHIIELNCTLPD